PSGAWLGAKLQRSPPLAAWKRLSSPKKRMRQKGFEPLTHGLEGLSSASLSIGTYCAFPRISRVSAIPAFRLLRSNSAIFDLELAPQLAPDFRATRCRYRSKGGTNHEEEDRPPDWQRSDSTAARPSTRVQGSAAAWLSTRVQGS